MKIAILISFFTLASFGAHAENSDIRRECVQKIAEFYGVELNSSKVISGTSAFVSKCQLTVALEQKQNEENGEEDLSIALLLNHESEFSTGGLVKGIWATLSENSELTRVNITSCSVDAGKLIVDFASKDRAGWRKNHRYQVIASQHAVEIKEKEWGLYTSGQKRLENCQF